MEALETIETRKSIRSFRPDPIPADVMSKILQAGSCSPSYTNTQPWEVVVVTGEKKDALKDMLLALASSGTPTSPDLPIPAGWPKAMEDRSREHGARRLNTLGIARDDQKERRKLQLMNYEFYGAPYVLFLLIDGSLGAWSIFDMGLFSQNLILAAHALGVGSCLQASVAFYAREIKNFLGVPEHKKLVVCISMGYADEKTALNKYRSVKQTPEEFTQWYG